MAKAEGRIISGDYKGKKLIIAGKRLYINIGFFNNKEISSKTVESYEVLSEDKRKSMASGVCRGLVGSFFFPVVGTVAGVMSAKNKAAYTIAIVFEDGTKALIECNDLMYKLITTVCF